MMPPPYELLTAAERDAIVAQHLREHLPSFGLTEAAARTWIDDSHPPSKRMFELALLKGAGMRARWGFSLDFVPHITGGRVRWHRSLKTAMLDVIVEPGKDALLEPTFIHGTQRLHDDLERLLPIALERARQTWQRGATERGLLDLVQEIRDRQTNCFRFDNYTQLPLAFAFLSARLGDLAAAEQMLEHYVTRMQLSDETAAELKALAREYTAAAAT